MVNTNLPCDEKGFQGVHERMSCPMAYSLHMSDGHSCWQGVVVELITVPDKDKKSLSMFSAQVL